jgi:transposase
LEVILTLSDRQWKLIEPVLPSGPGKPDRNGNDNRMSLEGMIWICRTGAPWRDLPEVFGKWDTVYRQFRRWVAAGVFDSIFDEIGDELLLLSAIRDGKPTASSDPGHTSSLPLQTPPV